MTLEEHVREAWDNAVENGYSQWLLEADVAAVAADMMDCDGDIQEIFENDFEALVTIVEKIRKER